MRTPHPGLRPWKAGVVAVIYCGVVLTGCSGDGGAAEEAAGPAFSAPASSSAAAEPTEELSALAPGLLPAEVFGKQATVVPLSREQLRQGAGLAADPDAVDISPKSCAAAVSGTQPQID